MDVSTPQAAEADLAGKAAQYRPDELARYAQRVMDWLHPDGDLTDTERARKRGITLSNQQYDGMSRLSGYLTPQARATFEAVLAKLAAPGATPVSARRYDSNMLANSREELVEVFDALDAELDRLDEVSFEVLSTPERLRSLERLECLVRRLPAVGHALINQLDAQASEEELGGTLCCALANRLRITKPEAGRRSAEAKP
ncbi:rep13E12 repeat protein [Mycobacterium tuberculosis]|nr:rep13E12 repeat protein [Mycobacterium tuberculosis]